MEQVPDPCSSGAQVLFPDKYIDLRGDTRDVTFIQKKGGKVLTVSVIHGGDGLMDDGKGGLLIVHGNFMSLSGRGYWGRGLGGGEILGGEGGSIARKGGEGDGWGGGD